MEKSGPSSTISEQQLQRQEGWINTKTDLAEQSLISSEKWLQLHGLKSNKLTLKQILSQIGFPHCEDYVASLGRPVASRYADGLFPQLYRAEDGRVYNLTAKSELIYQFVEHLTQAVESYKQRMDWLTSKSRQIFGVILEQCVTIVLDFGGILEGELDLCREALTMVLQEQVAHITEFNIIRVSQEPVKWQENATPVTEQSIATAISWVEKLTVELTVSEAGRLDALLEAGRDKTIESIYYFVVGDVPEESKELLLQRALEIPCPVYTVSFNARGEGTIAFLKDLSAKTHSRFHAFAERTECVEFPAFSTKDGDNVMTWNSRKLKGKLPPGAGVREDVFLVWQEMEEACSTLAQIQRLVAEPPKPDVATVDCESETTSVEIASNPEDTWDSKTWLQKYGLKAQKLSLYDVLADCSFRHADGVVDIKAKPENESVQTSAETNKKTVHAKYCSRFVHAPWKDGSLVHVNITKEKCKWYSERIHTALARIRRRIKWLQDGSQSLFGRLHNDCIYILIDTSHSMKSKLDLVKDKIIQFIQEQLKYKSKFNFVKFDGQAVAWREQLAEVNEDNLEQAQSWIRDIKIGSSTNTLSALKTAFADKETQAIYLLTDGRPDQPPETVIDQVKRFQEIPIYTISFNYNDEIANRFLKEVAALTGGEFHFYNFGCKDPTPPEAVQNEDLTLLVKEMEQGHSDLEKMQDLYSESLIMDWWYNAEKDGDSKHQKEICSMISTPEKCAKPQSDVDSTQTSSLNMLKGPWGLSDQKVQKKKVLHAESTKTSLLRSQMSSLRSSACSERKDGLSNASSRRTALSDKEMSILLAEEWLDDKSSEKVTREGSQVYDHDSSDVSSENWLKTYGLVAKKLTLMDALSVAAVPHSSTYVPVLDKHVVSKVFDEVFPLAHVCNDTNKMTLINPQGAKLNIYKRKVEQAIQSYEKRLNKIVWRALSQEEKEKLDANKPIQYLENKTVLNQALERLNWPISLKELSMLESEILAGKMYIQQAMELQEAAKKNYANKAPGEQQKLQGNPTKKTKSKRPDPLKGQKVIARCDENGFYFPGVVKKCVSRTQALVGFSYGDTKVVSTSFITPVGGAMPCPLLQVGDYVFAKIVIPKGFDFYVPAIVIALPNKHVATEKFYTVLKCNNRREFCPRSALIKISQNKYALSCSHIKSPPIPEDPEVEDVEARNSAFLFWPLKEADTQDSREPRREKPRRKKRPAKQPLQQAAPSDSDGSSHGISSHGSCQGTHPEPRVWVMGGEHNIAYLRNTLKSLSRIVHLTSSFRFWACLGSSAAKTLTSLSNAELCFPRQPTSTSPRPGV
ncbi:von Willebrand factor A domain-containing protein 3B isoform X1 [Homo sapiens]|uniref:Isoform 6 of von Willebrand factor A domain-containing protein 3B n=2 Tax=Homo sapiens TaxID=9606 RepID=Q502W6-6|nr:von Willebrand factor A domain-containing protein 3B isoform X1 [Homo sapiens]|eukprot:XP_005263954.1 von Willebrand factor A domain-containing protein 3B isoform X1 [Homo sapiens]